MSSQSLPTGAGPVGYGMVHSFAREGSEVCLAESAPGILMEEDPAAAAVNREPIVRD